MDYIGIINEFKADQEFRDLNTGAADFCKVATYSRRLSEQLWKSAKNSDEEYFRTNFDSIVSEMVSGITLTGEWETVLKNMCFYQADAVLVGIENWDKYSGKPLCKFIEPYTYEDAMKELKEK